jgi:hypothetical protein
MSVGGEQAHPLAWKQGGAVHQIPESQLTRASLEAEMEDHVDPGIPPEKGKTVPKVQDVADRSPSELRAAGQTLGIDGGFYFLGHGIVPPFERASSALPFSAKAVP